MNAPVLAMVAFAAAASFTPGPNNVMVAASGAHHGWRATLPACLGVAVGFGVMMGAVGLGLASVLAGVPVAARVLRWVAVAWLLVLAWRIARAGAPGSGPSRPPIGAIGAALFQWVNPKAWLLAVGAYAAFVDPGHPAAPQVGILAATFLVCGLLSVVAWTVLGSAAGRLLGRPWRVRAFNVAMAAAMVASILPVAFEP